MVRGGSEWLTPGEAGEILRLAAGTLANWRVQGRGPKFHRMGKRIRYARADVEAWLEAGGEQGEPVEAPASRSVKSSRVVHRADPRVQELEALVKGLSAELERAGAESLKAQQAWSQERLHLREECDRLRGELVLLERGRIVTLAQSDSGEVTQVAFLPREVRWSSQSKQYYVMLKKEAHWLPEKFKAFNELSSS